MSLNRRAGTIIALVLVCLVFPLELLASDEPKPILFKQSDVFGSRTQILTIEEASGVSMASLDSKRSRATFFPLLEQPLIWDIKTTAGQSVLSSSVRTREGDVDRLGILKDYSLLLLFEQGNLMRWESFRQELKGPFFSDWRDSATRLKDGFWDGDQWVWNLVLHPLQGGTSYYMARTRGASGWEAFAWSFGYSLHFELAPLGQAGIGNIAVSPVDLVVTPVAGYFWFRLEEWLQEKIDRIHHDAHRKILSSVLPARALTHLLRGQPPWERR